MSCQERIPESCGTKDVGYIAHLKVGVKHVTASLLARWAAWGEVDLPPHLLNILGLS